MGRSERAKSVVSKTLSAKQYEDAQNVMQIQAANGNWNYDPYMHGIFNGMEMMMAIIEDRDPIFKEAPDAWIVDIKNDEDNPNER